MVNYFSSLLGASFSNEYEGEGDINLQLMKRSNDQTMMSQKINEFNMTMSINNKNGVLLALMKIAESRQLQ